MFSTSRILVLGISLGICTIAPANHLGGSVSLDYTIHLEGRVRSRYDGFPINNAEVRSQSDHDRTNSSGKYELFIRGSDWVSGNFCGSTGYHEVCAREEGFYRGCSKAGSYRVCYDGQHIHASLNFSLEPIVIEGLPLGACKRDDSFYTSAAGGCKNLRTGNIISSMSSNTMDLDTAKAYCEDLEDNGFTDWSLPLKTQIATLKQQAAYHLNFDIRNLVWTSDAVVRSKGVVARISTRRAARTLISFLAHVVCVRR